MMTETCPAAATRYDAGDKMIREKTVDLFGLGPLFLILPSPNTKLLEILILPSDFYEIVGDALIWQDSKLKSRLKLMVKVLQIISIWITLSLIWAFVYQLIIFLLILDPKLQGLL